MVAKLTFVLLLATAVSGLAVPRAVSKPFDITLIVYHKTDKIGHL